MVPHLHYDDFGYLEKYSRKNADINKYAGTLGYFQIVTTKKMSAEEALDAYRKRDSIEKVFMASIVRTVMLNKMRELTKKTNDKKIYSVPNAINELEQVKFVQCFEMNRKLPWI